MRTELYEFTNPQKSIWLTEQYHPNSPINNVCGTLTINQEINKELLEKAISLFISSNDSLNIRLNLSKKEPMQFVFKDSKFPIKFIELNNQEEFDELIASFSQETFSLKNSFLCDFIIFKFKDNSKNGFVAKLHHLISDAWSMSLLIDEIINIYSGLLSNSPVNLNFPSYLSYIENEKNYLNSDKYIKDKNFWTELFDSAPEITSLCKKMDNDFSAIADTKANRKVFTLSEEKTNIIKNFCKVYKTSPYTLFMAALGIYTGKLNNTNNVILGTPVLNRSNFNEKHTIGMFISSIPFKMDIDFDNTFTEFLSTINKLQLNYFRHQKFPYDNLLEIIKEKYSISSNIYTTVLSYQNAKNNRKTSDIPYNTVWNFNGHISEELEIHISDLDDNNTFNLIFDYNISKFDENEINELNNRLLYVIEQIIEEPNLVLKNIEIITPSEKNKFLTKFNNTSFDYPYDKNILELFYENVVKQPKQTALVYKNTNISYEDLYKRASAIEDELIKNNVKFQDIVAIYMPKSIDYVASILAVLKLGAIYLPISSDYPLERTIYMLENSKTKVIICKDDTKIALKEISSNNRKVISTKKIEDNIEILAPKHFDTINSAYIIYTSGSTGMPKGVEVSQKALINHVYGVYERFDKNFTISDITLSIANISFDANVEELFIPLLFGCTLHLVSEDSIYDPRKLATYIYEHNITFTFIPPTILDTVYENLKIYDKLSLNKLLVGVQSIKNTTLNNYLKLIPGLKIHNGYGPTEATICCISKMYNEVVEDKVFNIPIGKAMNNCEVYLLNKNLTLQPFGYTGEICISGDCLAKGYLYNKDKTKENFVYCKSINKNIYRTGDYAYYLPNGEIMYVGRIDLQVKLNGYRIELSEIDGTISRFSNSIINSISLVYEKKIYTFLVGENVSHISLKQYLKTKLPYYMIPVKFINITEIPSTKNGKLDKEFLINILKENIANEKKVIVLPSNKLEKTLIKILSNVLEIPIKDISMNDNFFEIGGDSLSAIKVSTAIQKKLEKNLPVKKLFEFDTIKDIADFLSTATVSSRYIIKTGYANLEKYPLSSAQKRVYLASEMAGQDKLLYNMPGIIELPKNIDITRLESAINKLIERNSILRTYFIKDSTGIYQKILNGATIKLEEITIEKENFENYVSTFPKMFDLSIAPLLRCEVINVKNDKKYLLIDMHHIISDGESTNILIDKLAALYSKKEINDKEVSYIDFTLWENYVLKSSFLANEKTYWINKLKSVEILNLPTDFPRPTVSSYTGNKYLNYIDKNLSKKIKDFCTENHLTPYMFLLGAFNILMYNFCRQDTITLGTPFSNRHIENSSNIIGMFVNTLVVSSTIDAESNIKDYLSTVKYELINSCENQIFPLNEIKKFNNLINTMFIFQNNGIPKVKFDTFETEIQPIFTNIAKFDLSVEVIPNDTDFKVIFEYCTDLFRESTIESLFKTYINILNYIVTNANSKISDIELLNPEEKESILLDYNNTKTNYPKDTDIYSLFLEQVNKTPNDLAVFFEGNSLSYKEFNKKVFELSESMKLNGVTQNDIVAILIDKSLEAIIAMFATLKLGAAFLPIDVQYPTERINYMLTDSQTKLLLTTNDFVHKTTVIISTLNISLNNTVIYGGANTTNTIIDTATTITSNRADNNENCTIEHFENNTISTESPAYIMYTSGSTGNPKGTIIKQKNIIRLVKNTNFIEFNKEDRMLQTGSIVFDACTFEIFGALLNGLPLYIIKKEDLLDTSNLQDYILKHNVNIMWLTAPLFNQLSEINPHMFNGVKYLLTGGDALSPKHINMVRAAEPNLQIINGYGPTENTTFSTCFNIDKTYKNNIPIGKPIANSTCYIVSKNNKLLPVGFAGELWVGGDGVSLGYLNNPKMTEEKFISNPFGSEISFSNTNFRTNNLITKTDFDTDTIYKTGDLVRLLPDENIEFLERIDSQVKINGFRVELKEIDIKLTSYTNINEAFTIVNTINNKKCICSYITSNVDINLSNLNEYLKTLLPKYMLPKYITKLEKLPLNTNGKVDKKNLPSPIENEISSKEIVLPKNKTEEIFLNIFKKILNVENISTTDDFFEIGGDSLGAMKIQIEALSNGIKIEYSDIFTNSTVQKLANITKKQPSNGSSNEISIIDKNRYLSYNKILEKNNLGNIKDLKYESLGNVLLTGFTGFLGAHILDSFLKKENGTIYCLIREKENVPAMQRLKNTLNFYFENKYDKYIGNRIKLVNGDISFENLGLSINEYTSLGKKINTVIHSAALVKHYGTYEEFERINITGTKNIVKLCTDFNLKLMHISTISVSGNVLAEQSNVKNNFTEDKYYDETNFYIEQNIENLYVNSKFKGEDIVLDAISKGLKAYILRMGNLTSRFSEGKFQQNHFENAFVNRFKSILQIGFAPDYLLDGYVEFTPIDFCADAIIDLASHYNENYSVFHLLNDNHVPMERLCKELETIGIPIKVVSSDKFKEVINNLLQDDDTKDYLQGIINDLDENQELSYESDVKIESEFTKKVLKEIGFEWPYIDTNYLKNYFKYLSQIGYFNINIK